MTTGIKAAQAEEIMTLREMQAVMSAFGMFLRSVAGRKWSARCVIGTRQLEGVGAAPSSAVVALLVKIGGNHAN